MKLDLRELRQLVGDVVAEARKKTKKAQEAKYEPHPTSFMYAETFDFSVPLGAYNLYRSQGAVNWGPMTGPGTAVDDAYARNPPAKEAVREAVASDPWGFLHEAASPSPPQSIWEAADRWYDHMGYGLGGQTAEGIAEKKLGFSRLKDKLARKRSVRDPGALAASIGRSKYGAAGMAQKSAAGRRK